MSKLWKTSIPNMAEAGVEAIASKICDILSPVGVESYPFKVRDSFKSSLITHLQEDCFE